MDYRDRKFPARPRRCRSGGPQKTSPARHPAIAQPDPGNRHDGPHAGRGGEWGRKSPEPARHNPVRWLGPRRWRRCPQAWRGRQSYRSVGTWRPPKTTLRQSAKSKHPPRCRRAQPSSSMLPVDGPANARNRMFNHEVREGARRSGRDRLSEPARYSRLRTSVCGPRKKKFGKPWGDRGISQMGDCRSLVYRGASQSTVHASRKNYSIHKIAAPCTDTVHPL